MYSIISLISAWIIQFYLPNPFATILNPSYADIFNILVGGAILHFLSYGMTSIYYERGSMPVVGSISYLFWYVINTFIFIGIGKITFSLLSFSIIALIAYSVIIALINYLTNKSRYVTL